jgi:L-lactate dehydrogenase complex protein LldG
MTARDAFLERVRRAAEQGRAYRVHLQDTPADIGYVGGGGDLVERFVQELTAVGGEAYVVGNVLEGQTKLRELLGGASRALCWRHPLLDDLGLVDALASAGAILIDHSTLTEQPAEKQRQGALGCDVGVTSCDWAIAETGTLVMRSRPGQERVASLLPPTHIAVVYRRQIVPDLIDAFRLFGATELPSNITFITGPSKTGDIELQLTTGVHGPGRLQMIVINEGSAAADHRP